MIGQDNLSPLDEIGQRGVQGLNLGKVQVLILQTGEHWAEGLLINGLSFKVFNNFFYRDAWLLR
jgi:hypothetical protein